MFIFDAFTKIWTSLNLPNSIKLINDPLIGLSNAGNDENAQLVFYAEDGRNVPSKMFWMPVR